MKLNIKNTLKKMLNETKSTTTQPKATKQQIKRVNKNSGETEYKTTKGNELKAKRNKLITPNKKQQIIAKQIRKERIEINEDENIRISKALAMSGVGSRRYCDNLVQEQQVIVNGKIAQTGQLINHNDKVEINNKQIKIKWADRLARIIIYHKPEGELVSRDDSENRVTVFEKIPRWYD